jgi:UDP-glucose 4-epimerase
VEGVEVLFHLAALGSVPRSVEEPVETDQVNVGGTVVVLDQARRAGVRRVVFAASSAAYGDTPALPKSEEMSAGPLSPYAVSKLAGEHYMKVFAALYGLETISLRYFNVFGPNQLPDGPYAAAIPRFIHAALTGKPVTIFGDGEQTRDFCFVANAVRANLLAAESTQKFAGEVVNIAGGRRVTLRDLVQEIGRVLGRPIEVRHTESRPGDVRHSLADISRARKLIGYEPRATWEEGIAPTVEFLREFVERGIDLATPKPGR